MRKPCFFQLFTLFFLLSFSLSWGQQPQLSIKHEVKSGETAQSIASAYNIEITDLLDFNKKNSSLLSIGEVLYIPNQESDNNNPEIPSNLLHQPAAAAPPANLQLASSRGAQERITIPAGGRLPIIHQIDISENAYSLASNFNVPADSIFVWNKVPINGDLHPKKWIIVGYESNMGNTYDGVKSLQVVAGRGASSIEYVSNENPTIMEGQGVFKKASTQPVEKSVPRTEEGKAWIVPMPNSALNKAVAIYKKETVGEYIKVINPINPSKYTAVKVLAELPPHEAQGGIVIKLSAAVCRKIGIKEDEMNGKAFPIKIEYIVHY
ncbi:lytic transglycosylase [Algivirga pacifica]|uniref:LysM domain-containing protein n=1 Tax=Algivirga pacifica TaxID=1162670 RepID=A0ABP9DEU0_9BACT